MDKDQGGTVECQGSQENAAEGVGEVEIQGKSPPKRKKKITKIFYATRTHSQIAQVSSQVPACVAIKVAIFQH